MNSPASNPQDQSRGASELPTSSPTSTLAPGAAGVAAFTSDGRRPLGQRLLTMLGALNPIAMFFGPLFQRDMRILGRRRGTYWTRFGVTVLVGAIVVISVCGVVLSDQRFRSGAASIERMQEIAPQLTLIVFWLMLILLTLTAPMIAAGAFIDERMKRTLHALTMTPMRPLHIAAGKVASRFASILILSLIAGPIILAMRVFGGIDADFSLQSMSIVLSSALLATALSVWASLWCARVNAAYMVCILILLLCNLFPVLWMWITYYLFGGRSFRPEPWSAVSSSVMAMADCSTRLASGGRGMLMPDMWLKTSIFNLILSGLAILLTTWQIPAQFRRESISDGGGRKRTKRRISRMFGGKTIEKDQGLSIRSPVPDSDQSELAPASAGAAAPAHTRAPGMTADSSHPDTVERYVDTSRIVGDNAVLWRELRQPTFRSAKSKWFTILTCIGIMIWTYVGGGGVDEEGVSIGVTVSLTVVALLSACAAAAGAIAGEREAQTLSVLLAAPITPRQIIWAKVLGTLARQWVLPSFLALHLLIVTVFGATHPVAILFVVPPLVCALLFLSCSGVMMSLFCQRSSKAGSLNFLLALSLWLIGPILIMMLIQITMVLRREPEEMHLVMQITNPMWLISEAINYSANSARSLDRINVPLLGKGLGTFGLVMLLNCAFMILLSLICLAVSERIFYRKATAGV